MTLSDALEFLQAQRALRDEEAIFEHNLRVRNRISILQTIMGYAAIALLFGIMVVAGAVVLNHGQYSETTVTLAAAALFGDSLAGILAVWKVFVGKDSLHASRGESEHVQDPAHDGRPLDSMQEPEM